jgi:hypothetical protein
MRSSLLAGVASELEPESTEGGISPVGLRHLMAIRLQPGEVLEP